MATSSVVVFAELDEHGAPRRTPDGDPVWSARAFALLHGEQALVEFTAFLERTRYLVIGAAETEDDTVTQVKKLLVVAHWTCADERYRKTHYVITGARPEEVPRWVAKAELEMRS